MQRKSFDLFDDALGHRHSETLLALIDLALLLEGRGKPADAEALLVRTVEFWESGENRTPAARQGVEVYIGLLERQARRREAGSLRSRLSQDDAP